MLAFILDVKIMATECSKTCDEIREGKCTATSDETDIDVTSIADHEGGTEEVSKDSVEVSTMQTDTDSRHSSIAMPKPPALVKTEKDTNGNGNKDIKVPMSINEGPVFNCNDPEDMVVEDITERDSLDRFYFESDHLVLKDNKDYQELLRTLVALEAQRKKAVLDYEELCRLQNEALQDPIRFVEKLQNNESLNTPARQHIVKLPNIAWDQYALSTEGTGANPLQPHTRAAMQQTLDMVAADSKQEELSENSLSAEDMDPFAQAHNSEMPGKLLVRGRAWDHTKPVTFNQPWSAEEQSKLERLLQIYPPEEVEAKRWEKIALALGNRTVKQVASRVQKYFIKLAKAGLPVPGRIPNVQRNKSLSRNRQQQQFLAFKNSTFFPSYQPKVYMEDEDVPDSGISTPEEVSEDESIPVELRGTEEYKELMNLRRLKQQQLMQLSVQEPAASCNFMCDGCGMDPIQGLRWHCIDCPEDTSTDFCSNCVQRADFNELHTPFHHVEPVKPSSWVDDDYTEFAVNKGSYNYLDPNFLPATS